jgi:hypothetical protein
MESYSEGIKINLSRISSFVDKVELGFGTAEMVYHHIEEALHILENLYEKQIIMRKPKEIKQETPQSFFDRRVYRKMRNGI